jgi:hypothetical protein
MKIRCEKCGDILWDFDLSLEQLCDIRVTVDIFVCPSCHNRFVHGYPDYPISELMEQAKQTETVANLIGVLWFVAERGAEVASSGATRFMNQAGNPYMFGQIVFSEGKWRSHT